MSGIDQLVEVLKSGQYLRMKNYKNKPVMVSFDQAGQKFCVENLYWDEKGELIRQYYVTAEWLIRRHPYIVDPKTKQELTGFPYRDGDPVYETPR